MDLWRSSLHWKDRLRAVSWPRASVLAGVTGLVVAGLWLGLQPSGIQAHAPRLPTEAEWEANQSAADAFDSDLSPALAAANRSETPGTSK